MREPVFTTAEIATEKKLPLAVVIKLFRDETGVIRLGRKHFMWRIPESVVQRVFDRLTTVSAA